MSDVRKEQGYTDILRPRSSKIGPKTSCHAHISQQNSEEPKIELRATLVKSLSALVSRSACLSSSTESWYCGILSVGQNLHLVLAHGGDFVIRDCLKMEWWLKGSGTSGIERFLGVGLAGLESRYILSLTDRACAMGSTLAVDSP